MKSEKFNLKKFLNTKVDNRYIALIFAMSLLIMVLFMIANKNDELPMDEDGPRIMRLSTIEDIKMAEIVDVDEDVVIVKDGNHYYKLQYSDNTKDILQMNNMIKYEIENNTLIVEEYINSEQITNPDALVKPIEVNIKLDLM